MHSGDDRDDPKAPGRRGGNGAVSGVLDSCGAGGSDAALQTNADPTRGRFSAELTKQADSVRCRL